MVINTVALNNMKNLLKIWFVPALAAGALVTGCSNGDNEFNDFDYQTVYFANQYADRALELGEDDQVDLTLDNAHKVCIKAAWGGGYTNRRNVFIDFVVDPSLVEGLYFKNTETPIQMMPAEYYTIADKQIKIAQGEILGGVDVQLTDAFFADPKSASLNYVIPLRMTGVEGADRILEGTAIAENPVLTDDSHWSVQPKNFVLYAIHFANPWHGQYLRRGVDQATIDGAASTIVRHQAHVEDDEVVDLTTSAYKEDIYPVVVKDAAGNNITANLTLTFSDDNNCSVSSNDPNVTASGTGKFVKKGEKASLGGKDRNAIYLDYTMTIVDKNMTFASRDTLVLRTRNVYHGPTFGIERK